MSIAELRRRRAEAEGGEALAASASVGENADRHRSAGLSRDAVIIAKGEVVGVGGVDRGDAVCADHRLALFASPARARCVFVAHWII